MMASETHHMLEKPGLPPGSMVLHFGGWKRLEREAVDRARLNAEVAQVFPMDEPCIRDVYGFNGLFPMDRMVRWVSA